MKTKFLLQEQLKEVVDEYHFSNNSLITEI
jgi:hypothetical protein